MQLHSGCHAWGETLEYLLFALLGTGFLTAFITSSGEETNAGAGDGEQKVGDNEVDDQAETVPDDPEDNEETGDVSEGDEDSADDESEDNEDTASVTVVQEPNGLGVYGDDSDNTLSTDDYDEPDATTLYGGIGDDVLHLADNSWDDGGETNGAYGGAGDDTLIYTGEPAGVGGESDASALYGGDGADSFVIAPEDFWMGLNEYVDQFQFEDGTWSESDLTLTIGEIQDFDANEDVIVIDLSDLVNGTYEVSDIEYSDYGLSSSKIYITLEDPDRISIKLQVDVIGTGAASLNGTNVQFGGAQLPTLLS